MSRKDIQLTTEQIVAKLQENFDNQLFEALVHDVNPIIINIIQRQVIPFLDWDDLYQECLVVLYSSYDKFKTDQGFYFIAFFRQVLVRRMMLLHRTVKRTKRRANNMALSYDHPASIGGESIALAEVLESSDFDIADEFISEQLKLEFFTHLDSDEMNVLRMRTDGYSMKETCERYGYSMYQVRNFQRRIRQKYYRFERENN